MRGSLAGHGWPAKWARTRPIPQPPTGPTTALSVWLKKSAALSRTQKHRRTLLTLGDTLAASGYFDHASELELVRHIRNGIAHDNRYNIESRGAKGLSKRPAHNHLTANGAAFQIEVVSALQGRQVLWCFMEWGLHPTPAAGQRVFRPHGQRGRPTPAPVWS